MRNYRPHRRKLASALLVIVTVICASRFSLAQSDARLGTVYYQVLYADKQVRDLPKVPDTNKGIRSVLRIATIGMSGPHARRSRTLSTKRPMARQVARDRTYRTQLTWSGQAWSGQAWIGSAADHTLKLAQVISTRILSVGGGRKPRPGRTHPLLGSLRELQNRRAFWKLAAIDIEAKMFEHAGTPTAGKKRWDLVAVGSIQRKIDRSIDQHRKALAKLARQGKLGGKFKLPDDRQGKPLEPTGKVVAAELGGKWTAAAGIAKPINEVHILPHRLQVWAAAPQSGRRTYHVTMAHAEAGTFGAFYYVAYADLTGDGLPDTPIARSTLAQSRRPGEWTSWSFITDAKRVFIGHAWTSAETAIYCRRTSGAEWRKLSREVYVAPVLDSLPRHPAGPYVSNCRIYSVPTPLKPTTQPTTRPAAP